MKVAPSILACDFAKLGKEIKKVETAGADYIHIDVMDGIFVPNITIGPMVIKSIRKYTKLPFDVHLMIENPEKYIEDFVNAGADIVTIHVEACKNIKQTLQKIKSFGAKAGISLKPGTSIEKIYPYLSYVDLVLVMTVEPGFGGQEFICNTMEKVQKLRQKIDTDGKPVQIEVDGGINEKTAKIAAKTGADICVAGSSVFTKDDVVQAIKSLRN